MKKLVVLVSFALMVISCKEKTPPPILVQPEDPEIIGQQYSGVYVTDVDSVFTCTISKTLSSSFSISIENQTQYCTYRNHCFYPLGQSLVNGLPLFCFHSPDRFFWNGLEYHRK